MIQKTRRKFILAGMAATLAALILLICAINLFYVLQTNHNLDQVLLEMSGMQDNKHDDHKQPGDSGTGQSEERTRDQGTEFEPDGTRSGGKGKRGSALYQYAGRYFYADASQTGDILPNKFYQELLTEEEITALVESVLQKGTSAGYLNDYRYLIQDTESGTRIGFLDCTTDLMTRRRLWTISAMVGLAGLLVSFLLIYLASGKIVAPLKESMDKQKQFITDAGHELKTPLSVIGTNMDILSMDLGENEWVDGTKKQVHKMKTLIGRLISLARMDEPDAGMEVSVFNVSDAAQESADLFAGAAQLSGRKILQDIESDLYVQADEGMVRQLFGILCDNAVKYARGEEPVLVRLSKEGRKAVFETANHWDRENAPEDLNRFFDRFYRSDSSRDRSGGQSGYGLGLSIAASIAEKNHIQLTVSEDEQQRLVMKAVFAGMIAKQAEKL